MAIEIEPIAFVRSPYKQKFAIPRQPNLVTEAMGRLVFLDKFQDLNLFRELDQFSHLWLIFQFHQTSGQGYSATVQPPRLGGKERVGVFASRSPFRPNSLGLSVVANLGLDESRDGLYLKVGGLDLVDGTPVFDIKPYIPYADSIASASAGFADNPPGAELTVAFSDSARTALQALEGLYPELESFIISVLKQDPRPAWRVREDDSKRYGMNLFDLNIKWRASPDGMEVLGITRETIPAQHGSMAEFSSDSGSSDPGSS